MKRTLFLLAIVFIANVAVAKKTFEHKVYACLNYMESFSHEVDSLIVRAEQCFDKKIKRAEDHLGDFYPTVGKKLSKLYKMTEKAMKHIKDMEKEYQYDISEVYEGVGKARDYHSEAWYYLDEAEQSKNDEEFLDAMYTARAKIRKIKTRLLEYDHAFKNLQVQINE